VSRSSPPGRRTTDISSGFLYIVSLDYSDEDQPKLNLLFSHQFYMETSVIESFTFDDQILVYSVFRRMPQMPPHVGKRILKIEAVSKQSGLPLRKMTIPLEAVHVSPLQSLSQRSHDHLQRTRGCL
jgi:hypothetical protein